MIFCLMVMHSPACEGISEQTCLTATEHAGLEPYGMHDGILALPPGQIGIAVGSWYSPRGSQRADALGHECGKTS